jgi:hypothetical protein
VTPFVVMLAAFSVLLPHWTGQADLTVLAPFGARADPATQRMIGMFSNLCPLRPDLSGGASLVALVEQAQDQVLEALEYRAVPYSVLMNLSHGRADLSCHGRRRECRAGWREGAASWLRRLASGFLAQSCLVNGQRQSSSARAASANPRTCSTWLTAARSSASSAAELSDGRRHLPPASIPRSRSGYPLRGHARRREAPAADERACHLEQVRSRRGPHHPDAITSVIAPVARPIQSSPQG